MQAEDSPEVAETLPHHPGLNSLQHELQNIISLFNQSITSLDDSDVRNQAELIETMKAIDTSMLDIQRLADQNKDINLPIEIVRLIDSENSPDKYADELKSGTVAKLQLARGKQDALQELTKDLRKELHQKFPEDELFLG